jgi:hypothetical protein
MELGTGTERMASAQRTSFVAATWFRYYYFSRPV